MYKELKIIIMTIFIHSGPPRLPIWGSYWYILLANYSFLQHSFIRMAKLYKSQLIGFYAGSFAGVVAQDYDTIKEILNKREFDGRMDTIIGRMRDPKENLRGIDKIIFT